MRIGILGGTFDPIHNGHLHLAREAYKKLGLAKIIFIPTYIAPHKKNIKITPAGHRYNMVKSAIANNKNFDLSEMELKRKDMSYSVKTVEELRKKYGPKVDIFFITGSDSLKDLDKWKDLKKILRLCKFVVAERPGFRMKKVPEDFISLYIEAEDISSTLIRSRLNSGKDVNGLLPKKVIKYITAHHLYC